jgi:hypothetical protein
MTSKERIRAVIAHQTVDHLPLAVDGICHGAIRFVNQRYGDPFAVARHYLDLGLDTALALGVQTELPADVETKKSRENPPGQAPLLSTEYVTPKGSLRQVIRKTEDYDGDSVSLFSDFNVPPSRSVEYLVSKEADLEKLAYVLPRVPQKERESLAEQARTLRTFCDENQVLLASHLPGVGDPLIWMSGVDRVLTMALEEPELLHRYVEIVSAWSQELTEAVVAAGVEHIVRRGWYESTDFWSPSLYEEFLFEPLRKEVALARSAGVTVTYVMASGQMPLLELIEKSGVDICSNIDPLARGTDVRAMRRAIGRKVALCGGVNNYEILERASPPAVRRCVLDAIEAFTPWEGCILAPSDSIAFIGPTEIAERNFQVMIDTWKEAVM